MFFFLEINSSYVLFSFNLLVLHTWTTNLFKIGIWHGAPLHLPALIWCTEDASVTMSISRAPNSSLGLECRIMAPSVMRKNK